MMSAAEKVIADQLREATNVVPIRPKAAKRAKPKTRPGTHGYKWTPAQRRKFRATFARKKAAWLKEERQGRRSTRERRSAAEREEDRKDALLLRSTVAPTLRKGKPGPEERLDAIVYLSRAYAAYAHVPDDVLLGLLALRTLQGRIK